MGVCSNPLGAGKDSRGFQEEALKQEETLKRYVSIDSFTTGNPAYTRTCNTNLTYDK